MSSQTENFLDFIPSHTDGFSELQKAYAHNRPTSDEIQQYGTYSVSSTALLDTPPDVLASNEVLTNPSQIENMDITIGGERTTVLFAYFRREPLTLHLGKTKAEPYLLIPGSHNKPYLSGFTEAMPLQGEDPRITQGVKVVGPTGKIHTGWCVSTVVATPRPDNPADAESIKQVFYWGERLNKLEPFIEVKDLKNTCIYPLAQVTQDEMDVSLDVFGRPHPHITYARVPHLGAITKELVEAGSNLTEGFLPTGVHTGVNNIKSIPGHPDLRELDIHEAYAPITSLGKVLHYRLGRYGVHIPTGKLTPLGVVATRAHFPEAEPKLPENGVCDYSDIVYGSLGNAGLGMMITGVSDRHVGFARINQAAQDDSI